MPSIIKRDNIPENVPASENNFNIIIVQFMGQQKVENVNRWDGGVNWYHLKRKKRLPSL